jgi:hypothetical protein
MTISNNHEENEIMEQHDDNSGEQTDSGISSTFTNDMEQMFAETVNNVINNFNKDFLNDICCCYLLVSC